jgi:hypothetical protein
LDKYLRVNAIYLKLVSDGEIVNFDFGTVHRRKIMGRGRWGRSGMTPELGLKGERI